MAEWGRTKIRNCTTFFNDYIVCCVFSFWNVFVFMPIAFSCLCSPLEVGGHGWGGEQPQPCPQLMRPRIP